MEFDALGNLAFRTKWRCEDKTHIALLNDVARTVTDAGFQSCIGDGCETPGIAKIVRCLFGVAYIKFQVIIILDRHEILLRHDGSPLYELQLQELGNYEQPQR